LADVQVQTNAAGDHAIGVEVDGVFVPVAQVSAVRIAHAVERRRNLEERAEQNDEVARRALDEDFGAKQPSKSRSKSEEAGS